MPAESDNQPTQAKPAIQRSFARSLSRWVRRIILVCLVLGIVYVVWTNHRGTVVKQRITDELTSRGISLIPTSYSWNTDEPDPELDGTRFYEAAFKLRPIGEYDLPYVGMAESPEHCEKISPDLLKNIDKAVLGNAAFFRLISLAQHYNQFFYDMDYTSPFLSGGFQLSGTRSVGRWLRVKNLYSQGIGDAGGAVETWLGIDHVTRSLTDDSQIITVLVQISLDTLSDSVLEDMLSRLVLDESQLESIRQAIESRSQRTSLGNAFAAEITTLNEYLQNIYFYRAQVYGLDYRTIQSLSQDPDIEIDVESIPSQWELAPGRIWSAICPGWYENQLARYINLMLEEYQFVQTTTDDLPAIWMHGQKSVADSTNEFDIVGPLATMRTWSKSRARSSVVLCAIEVELFRLANNRWPDSLKEMNPIPVDPFTGNPFGYQKTSEGIILYSFGPNGKDDNGIQEYDDDAPEDADDIAFRLYNPEIRNSKPPKPDPDPEEEAEYQGGESSGY
jgi:hypothetical protein